MEQNEVANDYEICEHCNKPITDRMVRSADDYPLHVTCAKSLSPDAAPAQSEPPQSTNLVDDLNPAKKVNLITALEHQMLRNHPFDFITCRECEMSYQIATKLREDLGL